MFGIGPHSSYFSVTRPHRMTTFVDAAYCYRRTSVVCLSVCLSVTIASPAKTAEPNHLDCGLGWAEGATY